MFKNSGLFGSSNSEAETTVKVENQSKEPPSQDEEPPIITDNSDLENTHKQSLKDLSKEDVAKLQALRSKMISASFGDMVTLLMRSPHYKHYSLADLKWLVFPPLLNNQFLIAEVPVKNISNTSEYSLNFRRAAGVVLWAKVSPEVNNKLIANLEKPIKLNPDEWTSGDINWVIDIVADPTIMQNLLNKLRKDIFKDATFYMRLTGDDGETLIKEIKHDTHAIG